MDFENASMEELVDEKTRLKGEIEDRRDALKTISAAYNQKVKDWHTSEAYVQLEKAAERDGRTMREEATFWLTEENADDPGHRIQAGLFLKAEGIL